MPRSPLEIDIPPNTEVRVHKSILLLHPSAKLWYLCRSLDPEGRGFVILTPDDWGLLKESKSTIYRWMQQGKKLGFFLSGTLWSGENLRVALGGLLRICRVSSFKNWGTVATVPLSELLKKNGRRITASAIATQDLQERSRYCALQQLNQLERRCFDIPTVDQILDCQTSQNSVSGGTSGIVHVGEQKVFVGQRFIPFGVSQASVCETLNAELTSCGVSDRTLRRHLNQLGITTRQIVQAKPEYEKLRQQLKIGRIDWTGNDISSARTERGGIIRLYESNGISSACKEGGLTVNVQRFCRYFGTTWIYRCNLYNLDYELTSMKFTRHLWKEEMNLNPLPGTSKPVEKFSTGDTPQTPQINAMPDSPCIGGESVSENKADKNDNPPNIEPEAVSSKVEEERPGWEEMKRKLLEKQQKWKEVKIKSLGSLSVEPMREYFGQTFQSSPNG